MSKEGGLPSSFFLFKKNKHKHLVLENIVIIRTTSYEKSIV